MAPDAGSLSGRRTQGEGGRARCLLVRCRARRLNLERRDPAITQPAVKHRGRAHHQGIVLTLATGTRQGEGGPCKAGAPRQVRHNGQQGAQPGKNSGTRRLGRNASGRRLRPGAVVRHVHTKIQPSSGRGRPTWFSGRPLCLCVSSRAGREKVHIRPENAAEVRPVYPVRLVWSTASTLPNIPAAGRSVSPTGLRSVSPAAGRADGPDAARAAYCPSRRPGGRRPYRRNRPGRASRCGSPSRSYSRARSRPV